jgi:3-oxoacyl-[acyl-carrier protein] reductase
MRSILVTGASKGIGRAIATRLARDGFDIAVHFGKDEAGAKETLESIKAQSVSGRLLTFDVTDRAACREVLEADIDAHGPYWGVVLSAGVTRDNAFPAMEGADWDLVIDTSLGGFYNVLHPVIMPMVSARRGGRIVAIASVSGITGNRGQTNYSAAKGGVIAASKSLAVELAKRDITVNCVAPGAIETQMTENLPLDKLMDAIPMRRLGKPDDVAGAVSFLCSEDAAYVTRQVISVNGGMI